MIKIESREIVKLAAESKHKPIWILQILIFYAVFTVVSIAMSTLLFFPEAIYLITSEAFKNAIVKGDIIGIIEFASNLGSNMPDWLLLVNLVCTIPEIILPINYVRFIEKRKLKSMGFVKKDAAKMYGIGYLIGAGMIVLSLLICMFFGAVKISFFPGHSTLMILLFLQGYLIQGMAEEVLLRGYFMMSLFNGFKGKGRAQLAVVVSSVAFSLLHLANPGFSWLAFINIVLAGVFFGLLMLKTGSIWASAAAHSAWNFVQGNIIGANVSGLEATNSLFATIPLSGKNLISGGSFGFEGGLAVTIVMTIGILLLIFLPDRKKQDVN